MKTENQKSLGLFLLYVVLSLLMLCSCGTRKKALQAETIKKEVVNHEKKDITVNGLISTVEEHETYTPIDPTKPMITPDGKVSTNAKVEIGKKKKEETIKIVDKGETKKDESVKEKKKVLDVETKKPNPWLWIGLFALCVVALLAILKKLKVY